MTPRARSIRENILRISHASGHGHIPTCFSIVELLLGVYDHMHHDPSNPELDDRDIFILSKGHASLGQYCTMAEFGYFPIEEVYSFGAFGSRFGCHADRLKLPGIEASTGSLGHGIGLAVGMALAFKIRNSNQHVYTIIGDGESNEGTVWEALMVANNLELNNLTILFDDNGSQIRCLPVTRPAEKFRAFGCDVVKTNGHDLEQVESALKRDRKGVGVIVAKTVKGYGCKSLSDDMFAWHRRSPNETELEKLLEELEHGDY